MENVPLFARDDANHRIGSAESLEGSLGMSGLRLREEEMPQLDELTTSDRNRPRR